MKTGFSIDSFLLSKFQKISDWMQEFFGVDNFYIAKFLKIAMIISFFIREFLSFLAGIQSTESIVIICSLMVIIKIELISQRAQQTLKKNPAFINPVVTQYAATRLIMQLVGVAAFGFLIKHLYYIINPSVSFTEQINQYKEFFWDLFGMLMFFVSYFSSCTPKPYKPSKAKKLFEQTNDRIIQNILSSFPKPALS